MISIKKYYSILVMQFWRVVTEWIIKWNFNLRKYDPDRVLWAHIWKFNSITVCNKLVKKLLNGCLILLKGWQQRCCYKFSCQPKWAWSVHHRHCSTKSSSCHHFMWRYSVCVCVCFFTSLNLYVNIHTTCEHNFLSSNFNKREKCSFFFCLF